MSIILVILTTFLIIDSLFLGLLILVQLPKKEAGIGMAFGGGAADALFGAGSGNALSNLTKYAAIVFFVLVLGLSILNTKARHSSTDALKSKLESLANQPMTPPPSRPATQPAVPAVPTTGSNAAVVVPTVSTATNAAVPAK